MEHVHLQEIVLVQKDGVDTTVVLVILFIITI